MATSNGQCPNPLCFVSICCKRSLMRCLLSRILYPTNFDVFSLAATWSGFSCYLRLSFTQKKSQKWWKAGRKIIIWATPQKRKDLESKDPLTTARSHITYFVLIIAWGTPWTKTRFGLLLWFHPFSISSKGQIEEFFKMLNWGHWINAYRQNPLLSIYSSI